MKINYYFRQLRNVYTHLDSSSKAAFLKLVSLLANYLLYIKKFLLICLFQCNYVENLSVIAQIDLYIELPLDNIKIQFENTLKMHTCSTVRR